MRTAVQLAGPASNQRGLGQAPVVATLRLAARESESSPDSPRVHDSLNPPIAPCSTQSCSSRISALRLRRHLRYAAGARWPPPLSSCPSLIPPPPSPPSCAKARSRVTVALLRLLPHEQSAPDWRLVRSPPARSPSRRRYRQTAGRRPPSARPVTSPRRFPRNATRRWIARPRTPTTRPQRPCGRSTSDVWLHFDAPGAQRVDRRRHRSRG